MGKFRQLLVPLDFTGKNQSAVEMALRMAKPDGASVTLVHVIETLAGPEDVTLAAFYAQLEAYARQQLQRFAKAFEKEGICVKQVVLFGRRGPEIVRYAMENDVDLMVLSSHRISLDGSTEGWGTLSYQISIACQCPVLLVK